MSILLVFNTCDQILSLLLVVYERNTTEKMLDIRSQVVLTQKMYTKGLIVTYSFTQSE